MANLYRPTEPVPNRLPSALIAILLSVVTFGLSSCGAFFTCEGKTDCPTTTAVTTTCTAASATTVTGTIYGYATNSTCGTNTYLNGYTLSGGALSPTTGGPFNLTFIPGAAVITPANTFMYIASSSSSGSIYGYSIGTGGQITILASGAPLVSENAADLEVSADGKYLFSLNTDGLTIEQYSINSTTGLLTVAANYPISSSTNGGAVVPTSLKFAPNASTGNFLVAVLGTGGAETFSYSTSTGALTASSVISPSASNIGIYGATIDANNYLYLAFTNGLQVYSTTSAGVPTFVQSYNVGNGPHQVVLNPAGTFLYVANFSDSTISGFSVASGTLTALSGSPFSAPTNVISLGITSNGSNLLANGYNTTNGLQLFSISSAGAITEAASTGTGASTLIPAVIAVSH
jgi:6-phosphogluconolactonase (cycloisomerase 2 family)